MLTETFSCTASGVFVIKNDKGLHTRPCTEIVKCATKFKSDIYVKYRKEQVNAKSMLGLLMLAAPHRSRIRISAMGVDAEEAVAALLELGRDSFNIQY